MIDWLIKQSVCRLMLLAKSMTGEEVETQIIMVLVRDIVNPLCWCDAQSCFGERCCDEDSQGYLQSSH